MSNGDVTSPPLPPPPPPPTIAFTTRPKSALQSKVTSESAEDCGCKWASEYPELRRACLRARLFDHDDEPPAAWRYAHFDSLLQEGPTCGLVALSMLLTRRSREESVTPDELLERARRLRLTNRGEMFSARGMLELCLEAGGDEGRYEFEHRKGALDEAEVVRALLDGGLLLVPYDSDRNHSPCLKRGHSAHWALVIGVFIRGGDPKDPKNPDSVYVAAKHGKSLNVQLWRLSDLAASNRQLCEVADKRLNDETGAYVVPEGGRLDSEDGLSGQFVVIRPL